jgi:8-oxo-dGTP pyrophosphatase MutT (NUDIX family)
MTRALIVEKFSNRPAAAPTIPSDGWREAAVLLPLIERAGGMTLLLARRTRHLHNHPGQIGLPGGFIEHTDRGPVAAALRETHEEVGIPPGAVEVVGTLECVDTGSGFRVLPVVGLVDPSVTFALDTFEVEYVFELPLEFLMQAANYQRQSHFYVIAYRAEYIWGATAQILVNFARHLGVGAIPD